MSKTITIVTDKGVRKRIDPDSLTSLVRDNFSGLVKVNTTSFAPFLTREDMDDILTKIEKA